MKIGIDIREFVHGKMTGIGRYLQNFLEWAAAEKPDVDFYLYANQYTRLPLDATHLRVRLIPESITLFWDQLLLPLRMKKDKIDVFFSPYYKAPLISPCPTCVTIHDLLFLKYYDRGIREKVKNFFFVPFAKAVVGSATRVITDSRFSSQDIRHYLKTDPEKIDVVSINTPRHFFPERDPFVLEEVRRRYGIPGPYLLYVGNFNLHKNIRNLLSAYARLQKKGPYHGYSLVLGGVADHRSEALMETAAELHLAGQVILTGHLAERDLRPLYSGATLFAFPSRYEGYGLPIMEAMACGTPVVCSDRTSLPETAGGAALMVDPDDIPAIAAAMKVLIDDKSMRNEFIQKGLARVKEINARPSAERIFEILLAIAGGENGG